MVPIGDWRNYAMFFSERYLGAGREPPAFPLPSLELSALKMMGAHTVLMGAKFNQDHIGGLDIFYCTKPELVITKVELKERRILESASRKLDKQIRGWITCSSL